MEKGEYRFGFNGQETDSETGFQNYKFRMYDSRIARFFAVDPIGSNYPYWTPYQFAGLTPIWAIDSEGLQPKITTEQLKNLPGEVFRVTTMYGKRDNDDYNEKDKLQFFFVTDAVGDPSTMMYSKGHRYAWRTHKPKLEIIGDKVTGINPITPMVVIGDLEMSVLSYNISFVPNTSEFSNNNQLNDHINNIILNMNENSTITIIPNANFKNHVTLDTQIKEGISVGTLLENRGNAIKDELIKKGISEKQISVQTGSVSSGSTNTDFLIE